MYIVSKSHGATGQTQEDLDKKKSAIVASGSLDVLKTAKSVLEEAGYSVLTAKNGFQVLRYLQQDKPKLIVLDALMPILAGIEILKKFNDALHTSGVPVILLTGKTDYDQLLKGYKYGAAYCIPKPLTKTQLLNGIDLFLQ